MECFWYWYTVNCTRISNKGSVIFWEGTHSMQHCGKKRKGCQERILAGRDLLMFGTRANYHLRQWSVIHFSKARFRNIAEILAPIPPTHCTHQGHLPFAWLVPAAHPKAILNPHYCCSRTVARTSFIPLSLSRSDSQLHFLALYRATQNSCSYIANDFSNFAHWNIF